VFRLAVVVMGAATVATASTHVPRVRVDLRAQRGPQEAFLYARADIVIAGGAAGGGKTWGLLAEPLRHKKNPQFGAVIFRRTYPQIKNEGGLWDEAAELYVDAEANENDLEYRFPSGMTVAFKHLQHLKDAKKWTGAQVPLLCFDQLEEFEEGQFWYLLTRNRSSRAGIRPYVRATCNPVPDDDPVGGWLNRLISWWWDPLTGYAIAERSGVARWFVRLGEELHWGDSAAELVKRFPERAPGEIRPKSLTFIPAKLSDNPILERNDPGYRAWLMAQPLVERERLLGGNWKIKATKGTVFDRSWFASFLEVMPTDVEAWVRYWDKAGTEGGGKFSAGVLIGKRSSGRVIIAGVTRGQWSAHNRETVIRQTAEADKALVGDVTIWTEQEPGSGGKESAENTVRNLAGFAVHAERVTGAKLARAGPLASQAEARNVDMLRGPWNEALLVELQNFDGVSGYMDQVDASSGAFNKLHGGPEPARMFNRFTGQPRA
jgi:predicted phage terminase large subunit-like protein